MRTTQIAKTKIAQAFNQADQYTQCASVQQSSGRNLLKLYSHLTQPINTVLEFGCGGGLFTQQLVAAYPKAQITALDIAQNMLQKAQQTVVSQPIHPITISWQLADIEATHIAQYDLITGNFTAQWFSRPQETCQKLLNHCQHLLLAIPLDSSFGAWKNTLKLHQRKSNLLPMPSFDQWQQWLSQPNVTVRHSCNTQWLMFANPLQAAGYFKKIGAHASNSNQLHNLLALRTINKPLALNFDVAYFLASRNH